LKYHGLESHQRSDTHLQCIYGLYNGGIIC
jgi:hypothetical protein